MAQAAYAPSPVPHRLKLFIIGISGLLGLNLAHQARLRYEVGGCYFAHPVSAAGIQSRKVDVTSKGQLESALVEFDPGIIVNTVGLTDVDGCESDTESAYALNMQSARDAAACARTLGAKLVHISTDQLFDGARAELTEDEHPRAINEYGRTKGQGEAAVLEEDPSALVLRTNFYGWGTAARGSFSDWVLRGLEADQELTMFADVYFTPILINHLVDVALELADGGASGLFNVVGRERLSKYEFGQKVARTFGYGDERIRPISVDDLHLKANRPKEMSLSSAKVENHVGRRMPTVLEGLDRLRDLEKSGWRKELDKMIQPAPSHRPARRRRP